MIVTIDAGAAKGSIIVDAWKHGIEVETLSGTQLELCSGDDTKVMDLIKRFPSATILHKEKIKEVSIYEQ